MELVELFRIRRAFVRYFGILALLLGIMMVSGGHIGLEVHTDDLDQTAQRALHHMAANLNILTMIAMLIAAGFATFVGPSLYNENDTLDFTWTRPIARTALAARYIAVDVAAVIGAYVVAMLMILAFLRTFSWPIDVEPNAGSAIALSIGVAVMWYALVAAATAGLRSGGGGLAGILWPVSFLLIGLGQHPAFGVISLIARALDVLNPIAYLEGSSSHGGTTELTSLWAIPVPERAAIVWGLAAILCIVAGFVWKRREV